MVPGAHDHTGSASSARFGAGGDVRCIVLLSHGAAAPEELMSSLRARNLVVTTVSSPSAVMAELGLSEIEYRQQWSACYDEDPDEHDDQPQLPERTPMILLMVEPHRIHASPALNGAVARYYPNVLRWCYDPHGNPRLGPMASPPLDEAGVSEDREDPVPEIHTRPVGLPKPRPVTTPPPDDPVPVSPPLRLHPGESDTDDSDGPVFDEDEARPQPEMNQQTNGNGRHIDRAEAPDDEVELEPQLKPKSDESDPDEAVTSEELAMLLSPDDPESES